MPRSRRSSAKRKTSILVMLVVAVVFLVAGTLFVMRHNKAINLTVKPSVSPTPTVQGPAKTGSAPAGPEAAGATPTASPTTISNPSHPASSGSLVAPTGDLLNVSSVSLSGATGMESTCQAVPGASCYIQVSMNGTVKKVSTSETVPNSGADGVILNWNANQLTVGTWQVEAVAILNGQTAYSNPQPLTVTN